MFFFFLVWRKFLIIFCTSKTNLIKCEESGITTVYAQDTREPVL
jgi:hypothetical protein